MLKLRARKLRARLISSVLIDFMLISIAFLLTLYTGKLLSLDFIQKLKMQGDFSGNLFAIIVTVIVIRMAVSLVFQ